MSPMNASEDATPTDLGGWEGLQCILNEAFQTDPLTTDVIVTPGLPLHVIRAGGVAPLAGQNRVASQEDARRIVRGIETALPHLREQLHLVGDADAIVAVGRHRLRVHVFRQMSGVSIVFRRVQGQAPTRFALGLPSQIHRLSAERDGLILIAGAAGQGKTTTMAAVIQEINDCRACHITTVEDPIEYVHQNARSVIHQRCVGIDVVSFAAGVRAAVRQSAHVIVIGEVRDGETALAALQAAETGHLVIGTIHGRDVTAAIERFIGLLGADDPRMARSRFAHVFRWIIAQRLAPRRGGGTVALASERVPILEILGRNERSAAHIRDGDTDQLPDVMRSAAADGMIPFDDALYRACLKALISPETAVAYASNPADMRHRLLWGDKDYLADGETRA